MSEYAILIGTIVSAIATWCLRSALYRPGKGTIDADGWRHLRPNVPFAVTLAALVLITGCFTAVLVTGSYRTEDPGETIALLCLSGASGISAAVLGWVGFARRLRWSSAVLRVTSFGRMDDYAFASLRHIDLSEAKYDVKLTFAQGRVTVPMLASGSRELIAHLYALRPDLFGDEGG